MTIVSSSKAIGIEGDSSATANRMERDSNAIVGRIFLLKQNEIFTKYKINKNLFANGESSKGEYKRFMNLKYSGYVRFFPQYRQMPVRYSPSTTTKDQLTINGFDVASGQATGYQEPFLLLRIEGDPTSKTHFQIEYAFDNQLTGVIQDAIGPITGITTVYNKRVSGYRILQFQSSTHTKIGTFNIIAGGGANWYKLSPFTLWNYQYRDDMFERYPWDPEGAAFSRYNNYYAGQNMARDVRWGKSATQGFILEGKSLPKGFGFAVLYGKTDNSGGFQTYLSSTPKNMVGGRIEKTLKSHKIAVNYFDQFGSIDQANLYSVDQRILTLDGKLHFKYLDIYSELGLGQYRDSILSKKNYQLLYNKRMEVADSALGYNYRWRPCINIDATFKKEMTLIPLNLQFYYIDKSVVNVNSDVLNSANPHALATFSNVGTPSDITTFQGAITEFGQMTNNRWAVNLKHEGSYKKIKMLIAISSGQEIQNLFNIISFQHRANQFTRSRFGYFMSQFGPYGRLVQLYRRTFEKVYITDAASVSNGYKKGFNTIDFTLKYNCKLFGRKLILSNYNDYSSVSDNFSAVPTFTDKAFVRFLYTEFMAFYAIHPKVSVLGFYCYQRVKANDRTELVDNKGNLIVDPVTNNPVYSANGKPRDQYDHGFGIGLDYDYASRAGLYLRHRWYYHKDKNFINDAFQGQETSLELKIFF
jgi:hypothetical protein